MIVAILLNNKKEYSKACFHVVMFQINDNKISGVENEYLYSKSSNYLSLWFLTKKIDEVYVQETDEETTVYYKKIGIEVKTYEDLKKNPLFKSFII